ncbi:hypothetical protein [Candidatus Mycoplasma haematobovis]|uniref:hypothetical protein n=1 Tax=Candidatus Mycoplasma haematobovis TaxID=432608 RepID=UPI0016502236|nr:hypothetical protein [Candidatus Mycoplasma haematobovis]
MLVVVIFNGKVGRYFLDQGFQRYQRNIVQNGFNPVTLTSIKELSAKSYRT